MKIEHCDRESPSYFPVYVMSAFLLAGLVVTVNSGILEKPSIIMVSALALWHGVLIFWIFQYVRLQRQFVHTEFSMNGSILEGSTNILTEKKTKTQLDLTKIKKLRISSGDGEYIPAGSPTPAIFFETNNELDYIFLPPNIDLTELETMIRKANPSIEIEKNY